MAPGYPLVINGIRVLTSEALYQCCRFTNLPDVQDLILRESSPMTGKMKSKRFRHLARQDWNEIRVRVMRWCLRVKLAQNWEKFGALLVKTGDRPIVEDSSKDEFWGAKRTKEGLLVGNNVLGRLLMELREELRGGDAEALRCVAPLKIPDFTLLGRAIGAIGCQTNDTAPSSSATTFVGGDPDSQRRTVAVSGNLNERDWANLLHFLSASGMSPEKARVNIELYFAARSQETESKVKILESMAREFGIVCRIR